MCGGYMWLQSCVGMCFVHLLEGEDMWMGRPPTGQVSCPLFIAINDCCM